MYTLERLNICLKLTFWVAGILSCFMWWMLAAIQDSLERMYEIIKNYSVGMTKTID